MILQLGLIFGGPMLWFISKNRRWLILTGAGMLWLCIDVLLIAIELGG